MSTADDRPDSPSSGILPAAPDGMAAILERISDGLLALDKDGRIIYINEKAAQVFGRRRTDLAGKALRVEFPDDFGAGFHAACHEAARTGAAFQWEASFPADRWFGCRVYPAPDGLSIFFQDVTEQRESRRRLEENEQRYRSLFEQNVDAVFTFDLEGRFVDANPACRTVSGYDPEELRHTYFLPLVVSEDQQRTQELFQKAVRGTPQHDEITIRHKNGRRVALHIAKVPVIVRGAVVGVYGIAKNITARKQAEAALRESEAALRESEAALRESETWLRAVAEASPVPMTITRWDDSLVFYANRHVRSLFGIAPEEEVVGQHTLKFYAVPTDREALQQALLEKDHVSHWEVRLRRVDGAMFWASGAFQRMVYRGEEAIFSVYHDVTEHKQLLEEARAEAERDPLTGLLNHRAFHARLEEEAERARQGGTSLAIAVLDLDNFKFFNDAYGHAVGDEVLRQVSTVLRTACRMGDVLARFGGDEFALLMPDVGPDTTAEGVRARLAAGISDIRYQPPRSRSAIPIGLSAGVALFPAEAPTRLAVMQIADERLLRAKTGAGADTEAQRVRGAMRESVEGFSMLDALVTAVDNKDRYTRRHSEDVMTHGLEIARRLGLAEADRHTVAVAALLHDVGKIGVPDFVLRKPGDLTDEEFEAVKRHPNIGAAVVAAVPGLEAVLDAVRHHHERWDGMGYPGGLGGEAIPPMARLLAVADAYSAMTADRPYRKGMAAEQARRLLEQGAGTQWDPACVLAFLESDPPALPGPEAPPS